ncbi:MAG: carboxylating nicotinate-nucleotide diphosphorylase [Thermoleophilaceae bacterium]|nr:carboxylating nicotinate-nucleotide diphosphorylase [Thermoleophilaceae bacterium]
MLDVIALALEEDLGTGDLTTAAVVPEGARATATIEQRAPGVPAGLGVAAAVFARVDPDLEFRALTGDGGWREPGPLAELSGAADAILAGERVALNFLGRLSGVATLTARFVAAVEGTGARILDTRKTTPGLRAFEKEAVLAGGGTNHRRGLWDAVLVKENHSALAGGVGEATRRALAGAPAGVTVEVECASLAEVDEALAGGAGRILLDNMDPAALREAVALVRGRAALEASGGVTLETVRSIAETGVDYISVGALTHSAPALDVSLMLQALDL